MNTMNMKMRMSTTKRNNRQRFKKYHFRNERRIRNKNKNYTNILKL